MARFIEFSRQNLKSGENPTIDFEMDKWNNLWQDKVQNLIKKVSDDLDNFNFNYAAESLYEFIWHEFADKYIEEIKPRMTTETLKLMEENFKNIIKLLHPFMPFVTEEIYQRFGFGKSIMIDNWPSL
jgi:valyl-tRNA synthetase